MSGTKAWTPPDYLYQLESQLLEGANDAEAWNDREFVQLVWWASFGLLMHYTTWARVSQKVFEQNS